jgi:hypothetical protein
MKEITLLNLVRGAGLAASMLLAGTAAAECSGQSCENVLIDQLYVDTGHNGQNIWVRTSGNEAAVTGCAANAGVFLWLDGGQTQKKEVYALLMMAFSLEKPVTIRLVDSAQGCSIAYVYMNR